VKSATTGALSRSVSIKIVFIFDQGSVPDPAGRATLDPRLAWEGKPPPHSSPDRCIQLLITAPRFVSPSHQILVTPLSKVVDIMR